MSNILIIKHGSLGDIAQSCGAIQDIYENHLNDHIYVLTSEKYSELFEKCPYVKDILIDNRMSKYNLFYLFTLMKKIKKYSFIKVYDLQNSSRTNFYKKILFPNSTKDIWSSSITTLPKNSSKFEFDKLPVLERFNHQLLNSNIETKHTLLPNFDWACSDISFIKEYYNLDKYILLFPFCSPHLPIKKWPYYNELIKSFKNDFGDNYKVCLAPGPYEIKEAINIKGISILNDGKALNICQLASIIRDSSFVIANDTGPAHIAAHLGVKGVALHGSHKSAKLQSIERANFKAIQVSDLSKLSPKKVYEYLCKSIS
tara:strand:- start:376 stop:1317 length:942 start_codon:yes stop_codon:yes gene_type:complete